jgi:ParB family transcriptional regulator, chromosome partitioning protein
MSKRSGLGRGLDALIPGGEPPPPPTAGVAQIPVEAITRNPHQPRTHFDEAELDELAASIREHGVLQPLLVTLSVTPDQYTLIAGERRLLASQRAGLTTVPAIVREANQQQLVEWALIENVQRADLSPLETAEAYRQLHEDFGLTQEEVANQVGKSRVAVTNTLRLLKLPEGVRHALAEGSLSEGHARALLGLSSPQAQIAALDTVLKNGLTVRQTEDLVRKMSGVKPASHLKTSAPPEITSLEERLRTYLGTKVNLSPRRKGGTLVIHYYSDEELDALMNKLMGEP